MTDFPFCAVEFFLLMSLLKFNFWSVSKLKCFGEALHTTGILLRETFCNKGTSWACLVLVGLKIVFYWYAQSEVLCKSLLIFPVKTLMLYTIEKMDVSSANSFMFDIRILGRSFIYTSEIVMDIKKTLSIVFI